MAPKCDIVVVGAGVIGLTTALLLAKDKSVSVTVVAKHMPGDLDPHYASPQASACYLPMAAGDDMALEKDTWGWLSKLASSVPEAGVHFQKCKVYRRHKDLEGRPHPPLFDLDPWFAKVVPNYRHLPAEDVPAGYDSGSEYTSVCVNTTLHLSWLMSQCLSRGVIFRRADLSHILSARHLSGHNRDAESPSVRVIVNATGLGSYSLGGVLDRTLHPMRGQSVLVRNEIADNTIVVTSGTDDGDDMMCYAMMRAAGGGTFLGGTWQPDNWSVEADEELAQRIIKRALAASEGLRAGAASADDAKVDVIRHGVGFRPFREGGSRIEKVWVGAGDGAGEDRHGCWVVHNYGHAGWGYVGGYASAVKAVGLVKDVRRELAEKTPALGKLLSYFSGLSRS